MNGNSIRYNAVYLSSDDKIALVSNLSTMLAAGIPILETVSSLLEDAKGNTKIILEELHRDLAEGKRVNTTFGKFPRVFDKVTVNLVKAAEEAGTLEQILKDLKDSIKKDAEFSDKIRGALAYPLLIVIIFISVLMVMLVVVIPKIATVFSRLTIALPLPTRVMLFASNIVTQHTAPLLLVLGGLVGAILLIYRQNRGFLVTPFLNLPYISGLVRKIDISRFSHSMHLLLNSGLPITTALLLVQDVVIGKAMQKGIMEAREMVTSGKPLAAGLKVRQNLMPTIVLKLIEVGDRTGTLDKSMQDVSEYMEYEVDRQLKVITVLLEPIMLVFVGVAVGGMMLAIIAPIYGLIGQVGAR